MSTVTAQQLETLICTARDAIKAYKASLSIDALFGEIDLEPLNDAREALGNLHAFGVSNPGIRTGLDASIGTDPMGPVSKISVNGIDAWEAIIAGCGIKGGTARIRKGKMSTVKVAGKAIMASK